MAIKETIGSKIDTLNQSETKWVINAELIRAKTRSLQAGRPNKLKNVEKCVKIISNFVIFAAICCDFIELFEFNQHWE